MLCIPIRLAGETGVRYTTEPLTFGVPFAEGAFPSGARRRCVTANGRELPLQTSEVATWKPDLKHVKWLLADLQADPERDGETVWLEAGKDRSDPADQTTPITTTAAALAMVRQHCRPHPPERVVCFYDIIITDVAPRFMSIVARAHAKDPAGFLPFAERWAQEEINTSKAPFPRPEPQPPRVNLGVLSTIALGTSLAGAGEKPAKSEHAKPKPAATKAAAPAAQGQEKEFKTEGVLKSAPGRKFLMTVLTPLTGLTSWPRQWSIRPIR